MPPEAAPHPLESLLRQLPLRQLPLALRGRRHCPSPLRKLPFLLGQWLVNLRQRVFFLVQRLDPPVSMSPRQSASYYPLSVLLHSQAGPLEAAWPPRECLTIRS